MEHAQEMIIGLFMLALNMGFIAALIMFYLDDDRTPQDTRGQPRRRRHRAR